jgi:hypothetical protein
MIAGGAGIVLIISLFLEWYSVKGKGLAAGAGSGGVSGWEALSFFDILLFLIALVAIGFAVSRAMNVRLPQLPASQGLITLALGALALLLVLIRLISSGDLGHPEVSAFIDIGRSFGIFVALLAAAGVAIGGWLTWNEEGKPTPGRAGAGAGPAIGGGQPPYAGQPPAAGAQPQQAYAQPAAAEPTAAQPAPAAPAAQPAQAAPAAGAAKADWYPDPRGEKRLRYWDGSQWTDHTAD